MRVLWHMLTVKVFVDDVVSSRQNDNRCRGLIGLPEADRVAGTTLVQIKVGDHIDAGIEVCAVKGEVSLQAYLANVNNHCLIRFINYRTVVENSDFILRHGRAVHMVLNHVVFGCDKHGGGRRIVGSAQ